MTRRRYGRRRGRRRGLHIGILPAVGLLTSAYFAFHDAPTNSVSGFLGKVAANVKYDWPLIIGIPLGMGLAARVARSVSNPRIALGGVSVSAF